MKYIHLIIGIILFSGVLLILFSAMAEMGTQYGSEDADKYSAISGNYQSYTEIGTEKNGTLRRISNKLEESRFSTVSAAVGAIDGALQAGKLLRESFFTSERLADQIQEDSGFRIHPIILTIIKGIISVVLIIIILQLFMKMKAET